MVKILSKLMLLFFGAFYFCSTGYANPFSFDELLNNQKTIEISPVIFEGIKLRGTLRNAGRVCGVLGYQRLVKFRHELCTDGESLAEIYTSAGYGEKSGTSSFRVKSSGHNCDSKVNSLNRNLSFVKCAK